LIDLGRPLYTPFAMAGLDALHLALTTCPPAAQWRLDERLSRAARSASPAHRNRMGVLSSVWPLRLVPEAFFERITLQPAALSVGAVLKGPRAWADCPSNALLSHPNASELLGGGLVSAWTTYTKSLAFGRTEATKRSGPHSDAYEPIVEEVHRRYSRSKVMEGRCG
jgi:hypothetical protein